MTRDLSTTLGRSLAYLDMLFVDHGLFRVIYNNFHALPGGLYRCSQPSPGQIRKYHAKYGIKTIVNLRGADSTRRYALEEQTCRELGIALVNHKGILSRSAPDANVLRTTRDLFNRMEYPALIHCKSGADRAGFAAALYRHFRLGEPIENVLHELDWYYGHLKASKTGILDFFFASYLADNAKTPIDFMTWVETVYDRGMLKAQFRPKGWADFIVDKVLDRE
ncbi:MAG TPA: tyrosine-protein phosphatase [Rhodocyclaceae bacterium]|nr:tyrosine-protein phosphatase [Rhodocyclaceae bacterium]